MTNTKPDMEIQAAKVEAFSQWAQIPVNATKSATTAILHGEAKRHGIDPMDKRRLASLLEFSSAIRIDNERVPFLHPTRPYKYLGALACPAMFWTEQLADCEQQLKDKGQKLGSSLASTMNRLDTIHKCIKPAITYTLGFAPFTMGDIEHLDKRLANIARQSCRLPKGFPTSAILRDHEEAGLGVISLTVDYAQISASHFTRALRDPGRLGIVSRALLDLQRRKMGGAPVEYLDDGAARYCTLLRQLTIMNRHGLTLTLDGCPYPACAPGTEGHQLWTLTALLRANLAPPSILARLYELGIKHIGQLVAANRTHLITTQDLTVLYGTKVTAQHKIALNQLSAAVSGQLPGGAKSIKGIRSTEALATRFRAIPTTLQQPPGNRAQNEHPRAAVHTRPITHPPFWQTHPTQNTLHLDLTGHRSRSEILAKRRQRDALNVRTPCSGWGNQPQALPGPPERPSHSSYLLVTET